MCVIDVREEMIEVTRIAFADSKVGSRTVAHYIDRHADGQVIKVHDLHEHVIISSKQHAQDLIKALNKAIELG